MTLRKSRLTVRKNTHSKTHIVRAKKRKELRDNIKKQQTAKSNRPITDMNFLGFDVEPLRPSLTVLSLFDGIATALHVLDRLNLRVEKYYSCEIDNDALEVQRYRFGERISMLGSVKDLTHDKLMALGPLHLLIGGSPCSDLSLVNHRRRGLFDSESSGSLFFDYVRIRNCLQTAAQQNGTVFYWLFENTANMENSTKSEMSRQLGCEPVVRNAQEFLPVARRRLFWGNLRNMKGSSGHIVTPLTLDDDILPVYRKSNVACVPTLTTTSHSQKGGGKKDPCYPISQDGRDCPLFITEIEALFGLPRSFTDGPNLSITQRRRLLGKAFCIPVIESLLHPLIEIFSPRLVSQMQ